ncbi:unknown [Firmicutes bacterium CAG:24]|nr:unknown [Firmicutes bacterium CAG:24]
MGKQNDAFTAYLGRAEVLADLYNGCLYQSYLCRRRHKVAMIAEQNWKFCSRFLRRKAPAKWRLG